MYYVHLNMPRSCVFWVDVLFEVTVEIKPKDWIPHGGSELQKGLLESLKNHVSVGMGRWRKTDGMSQIFM